jgi:phosphomethylpyrimidine synthase
MCGPKFCSMKITQEVRDYAAENKVEIEAAFEAGMKAKTEEYISGGKKLYREI